MLFVGGGPQKKRKIDPILLRVKDMIRPTVEGHINVFDNDAVLLTVENVEAEENTQVLETINEAAFDKLLVSN